MLYSYIGKYGKICNIYVFRGLKGRYNRRMLRKTYYAGSVK